MKFIAIQVLCVSMSYINIHNLLWYIRKSIVVTTCSLDSIPVPCVVCVSVPFAEKETK